MSWWETLHLVTWWKRLGISAIKTGQDAPSWIWCTERLSFFWGGHIVLQRFVHVRCHFQPLPTKLVFAYFDRGSYISYQHNDLNTLNRSSVSEICVLKFTILTQKRPSQERANMFTHLYDGNMRFGNNPDKSTYLFSCEESGLCVNSRCSVVTTTNDPFEPRKKNGLPSQHTDWSTGILIVVYFNPNITG